MSELVVLIISHVHAHCWSLSVCGCALWGFCKVQREIERKKKKKDRGKGNEMD